MAPLLDSSLIPSHPLQSREIEEEKKSREKAICSSVHQKQCDCVSNGKGSDKAEIA